MLKVGHALVVTEAEYLSEDGVVGNAQLAPFISVFHMDCFDSVGQKVLTSAITHHYNRIVKELYSNGTWSLKKLTT